MLVVDLKLLQISNDEVLTHPPFRHVIGKAVTVLASKLCGCTLQCWRRIVPNIADGDRNAGLEGGKREEFLPSPS